MKKGQPQQSQPSALVARTNWILSDVFAEPSAASAWIGPTIFLPVLLKRIKKASYSTAARRLPDGCQAQTQPSSMAFDKIRNDELATHGFDERLARITTSSQGWRQRAREICTQTSLDFSHIDPLTHLITRLGEGSKSLEVIAPSGLPLQDALRVPSLCAALVRRSFFGIPWNHSQERPYVNSSLGPYGPHNH